MAPRSEKIEQATRDTLEAIWQITGMPAAALQHAELAFTPATLPSSYHVTALATACAAAAGLAAGELWHLRTGSRQTVTVSSRHAEAEFRSESHLRIDGEPPPDHWGPVSGTYQCGDGRWVRIHATFPHHQAGALAVLGCAADRNAVKAALQNWTAQDFEDACGERGLVVFMMRSADTWARHPQAEAISRLPLFDLEKIGEAPPEPLPPGGSHPLSGTRVLDLTRVIAGPVCGRNLAAYGADVTRISAARLARDPINLEIDGGRGKQSRFIDLKETEGKRCLEDLVRRADVFVQGYRPGAIDDRGFSVDRLSALRPGIVAVSLSAWGHEGPWAHRRGFDSLVQTATGINHGEALAAGDTGAHPTPRPLPCQALDFASGYLLSIGAMAGLYKRATEGGSWRVRVALARTGHWLQSLDRLDGALAPASGTRDADAVADLMTNIASAYGSISAVTHPARLSETPPLDQLEPIPYPR